MNQVTQAENTDTGWTMLYKISGVAALIAVLFFRRNLGAEFHLFKGFGIWDVPATTPISASEWFALLQDNPFVGLTLFGLFDLINYALVGLIFLALYGALRRTNKSAMAIATTFAFAGIAVYFASNQAFAMLTLSGHYTAATSEAQRAMFLAAGEALLAINNPGAVHQGTGIYLSLLLVLLTGLIISVVMLRNRVFGKWAAYAGILANGFGLGYFFVLVFAPAINWLPPTLSAPFRMIWYVLIAIGLFRLARNKS